MTKRVTSIRIDDKLWTRAKHYAIDKKTTLTALVERALQKEITSHIAQTD